MKRAIYNRVENTAMEVLTRLNVHGVESFCASYKTPYGCREWIKETIEVTDGKGYRLASVCFDNFMGLIYVLAKPSVYDFLCEVMDGANGVLVCPVE